MEKEKLTLPANEIKERAILAAMIERQDAFNALCQQLHTEDFTNPNLCKFFSILLEFYKEDRFVDHQELIAKCQERHIRDAPSFVMSIANQYYIGMQYEDHAEDLQDMTARRNIIHLCQNVMHESCENEVKGIDIAATMIQKLYDIQSSGISRDIKTVKAVLEDFSDGRTFKENLIWMLDRKSNLLPPYEGTPCRYPQLDQTLGYFKKGGLYYIGGRTSMGKTTFMLNLIANQMRYPPIPVGIFSLEMSAPQITSKLLCMFSDVRYWKYEDVDLLPENLDRIFAAEEMFKKFPIYIQDPPAININQLAIGAQKMIDQHGIKILYIDYLTRIKAVGKYGSKHLEVDSISKALQTLARQLDIPIVCLCQLNRGVTGRQDPTPSLSDFRESGSIEEDCDGAILLHRPEYYNPIEKVGIVEVHVAKNRIRGIIKKIQFNCNKKVSERYVELLSIEEDMANIQMKNNFAMLEPDEPKY